MYDGYGTEDKRSWMDGRNQAEQTGLLQQELGVTKGTGVVFEMCPTESSNGWKKMQDARCKM